MYPLRPMILNEFPNYVMEESDYEIFLVDDKVQGSKYLPLKLGPPDQEITCEYLGDIPPFPQYFRRGKAPLKDADTFTNRIVASLLFPSHSPIQLPLQGLLKDNFSSDPHENSYDGAVIKYEPEFDRLLRTCAPNVFRKGTPSETEAEPNLLASNPAPKRFYAVANFLKSKPDLDLPASISLPKRISFAAQDFLDSEEPDVP
ncbi:uncharacterized protein EAE98_010098 [Botrytis deweyae]|uniref:Uncharacterized protein n=1 Tax=Botrytis deweyae TaxID=2478750 RepID=A0ABQ7I9R9_9HELO|nr:uncharacterized protein EAE98_010098 [Botrytis deweyae]KAF7917682.1 hypothetical protein EAE98_010098 [Botrytis deweyae]